MKKIIMIISALCIVSFFPESLITTEASDKALQELPEFTTSSKEKNHLYGSFILELYHNEIMKAMEDYYNDNNINGYAPHSQIDTVSISFKGNKEYKGMEKYSYILKISLIPSSSNGKTFGTDTLYFAVEPSRQTTKNFPEKYPAVELIKYEHSKPPQDTK
ncbi:MULTISPECIES: hypothetical protein [Bacillaceae]|uniref:hypothetical protein n=1 Tax=Bacillaceae TaxID=186817 RepID=UPI00177C56E7|nr:MULTISPECIES: hypothetical protein [Bacillaceae]MBT2681988.1 hypothetical protein [Bacillus sp. ISL-35]MBT2706272.1 hypothetical protein [Chryseobacterium sp. ISL-80]UYZ20004.1 hypothetical protein FOF60_12965 [Mesobacillus jeotgali]